MLDLPEGVVDSNSSRGISPVSAGGKSDLLPWARPNPSPPPHCRVFHSGAAKTHPMNRQWFACSGRS